MKPAIHPNWYPTALVTCACGKSFETGSTLESLSVDICHKCHPFFTGEMRFVDRQGRVDKFMEKMKKAQAKQAAQATVAQATSKKPTGPARSYKEILKDQQQRLKKNKTVAPAA